MLEKCRNINEIDRQVGDIDAMLWVARIVSTHRDMLENEILFSIVKLKTLRELNQPYRVKLCKKLSITQLDNTKRVGI